MSASKYIRFVLATEQNPKTSIWEVLSISTAGKLGEIRWWGTWRTYIFMPAPNTIYSAGCLRDITEFIESEMAVRTR